LQHFHIVPASRGQYAAAGFVSAPNNPLPTGIQTFFDNPFVVIRGTLVVFGEEILLLEQHPNSRNLFENARLS
jgi:hypothetical protein